MYSLRVLIKSNAFYQAVTKNVLRYKFQTKRDPGLQNLKSVFSRDELQAIEDADMDELESDFMQVNLSHREHEQELEKRKENEKLYIRKKYFKQKYPNFLTWSDIEQIRHLHRKDPDEWSIERLSDGFPALPNVIAKIATSNWTKNNESKIKRHDESVQENWSKFHQGEFQGLPPDLVEHLKKFSSRRKTHQPFKMPLKENVTDKNKVHGEFSEIVASYEKLKNKEAEENTDVLQIDSGERRFHKAAKHETYVMGKVFKKNVTLSELEGRIIKAATIGKEIGEEDRRMISNIDKKEEIHVVKLKQDDFFVEKFSKTGEVSTNVKEIKDYSHLIYPEKIIIPKYKRRKGSTYKLNDCYYADDGTFLYRVPGMTQ